MLMDIDTLKAIQDERYSGFVHEAQLLRLLRLQHKAKSLD